VHRRHQGERRHAAPTLATSAAQHETDEVEVAPFIAEWIRKAREMRDEGFRLYRSLMRKVQEAMRPARFPPAEAKAGHGEAVAAYRKLPTARLGVVGPRELGPQLEPLDPVDENHRRRVGAHEKGDEMLDYVGGDELKAARRPLAPGRFEPIERDGRACRRQ
jgi:hypothetical protein